MVNRSFVYNLLDKFTFFYNKKKNLRVLAYHTVPDKGQFETQINYISKNFKVISLEELKAHCFEKHNLPENSLLITFDDGDTSVLENGLPILKKYNLPSVLFIITSLIDSTDTFWCRWVEKAFEKKGKAYWEARKKVNYLKNISNTRRIEYLSTLEKIESKQLTSAQLEYMRSKQMFVGNHTHSHPMIDNCTEAEVKQELSLVKENFKRWDIEGYSIFAYPNGNWDPKTEDILIENGIKMAFLFDHKLNNKEINPLRISRIKVDADNPLDEFKVKVSGLHSHLMGLKTHIK